ncbi:hypothetical protein [Dinghuibacter silviterrae]|uniref:DUF3592 domain-containing protein n=1 Tax=Dinghuibacter silviterrae TaxID=1539049 RepID=A0A4R8DU75_9BACT|nr:hypothetical protein [Dinghuibacter silviterrae]TDX01699.1 hypothetical protein EDB95_2741 [Dinghuibacter silviterrae]
MITHATRKKWAHISGLWIFSGFWVFLLVMAFRGCYRETILGTHHIVTWGTVVFFEPRYGKRPQSLDYTFNAGGKTYRDSYKGAILSDTTGERLVGKSYRVIYYPGDPGNSALLLLASDFDRYHLPYIPPEDSTETFPDMP